MKVKKFSTSPVHSGPTNPRTNLEHNSHFDFENTKAKNVHLIETLKHAVSCVNGQQVNL
jgi:hypothetical protein